MDVVIVEDVPQDAKLLAHLVRGLGYEVEVKHNAQEAVQYVQDVPHLKAILMNIMMPELDGREATEQIRQKLYNPVPIVGVSSNDSINDVEKAMQSGMNSFLSKPYNLEKLSQLLIKVGLRPSK